MSERLQKAEQVFKKELSYVILKEFDLPRSILITLVEVKLANDFSRARVFVSIMPQDKQNQVIQLLNRSCHHFQQALNKKLFWKRIPKITFQPEKSAGQFQRLDQILSELKDKYNPPLP